MNSAADEDYGELGGGFISDNIVQDGGARKTHYQVCYWGLYEICQVNLQFDRYKLQNILKNSKHFGLEELHNNFL